MSLGEESWLADVAKLTQREEEILNIFTLRVRTIEAPAILMEPLVQIGILANRYFLTVLLEAIFILRNSCLERECFFVLSK